MTRHRLMMLEYYAAVEAWETAAEQATALYATELAEYVAQHPRPTFKAWLIDRRGQNA